MILPPRQQPETSHFLRALPNLFFSFQVLKCITIATLQISLRSAINCYTCSLTSDIYLFIVFYFIEHCM